MPGILPMKVIKVGNSAQARIAQACDRCRSKKIRCDGFRPSCSQCSNVGFECKTSDKLSRRAFPRGYTESLEERVRALELEIRELKDLLDAKDDKIDMLSRLHSPTKRSFSARRPSGNASPSEQSHVRLPMQHNGSQHFRIHQQQALHESEHHDARFVNASNSWALLDTIKSKAHEMDRECPDFDASLITPTTCPKTSGPVLASNGHSNGGPSRLLSDQMVNVFFQEWAPLLPVLHRPSFLKLYEQYVTDSTQIQDVAELVQLHLVFGISATSNKTRISYNTSSIESHWLSLLDTSARKNTMTNLQCLLLAQMFCTQIGDWARALQYKERGVGMAQFLGLNQSQKRFGFGVLQSETRKKVFWSLYSLDCFVSAFLGTPKSFNDHDVHCEYPMDVDDEYISEQGIQPVLPGESTKLSSALSVFDGARILSKTLTELYPSHTIYELSMETVSSLEAELDTWSNNLPPHLKMRFTDEKPSTHVISSRCPLLSLTYHYIRTLIHRPVACFAPADLSSASTVALAASSKHIIQLLALLDERNLSFSFPLNKDELLVSAGAGVLLQSLSVSRESKLMKDSQKTICTALEMLKRRKAAEFSEFRRMSCPVVFLNTDRRLQASRSSSDEHLQIKRDIQRLTSHFPAIAQGPEQQLQAVPTDHRRATLPVMPGPVCSERSPSLSASHYPATQAKRFRPIAPSTSSPRSSLDYPASHSASPKDNSFPPPHNTQRSRGNMIENTASASSSLVNLDFFPLPSDRPRNTEKTGSRNEQGSATDWEKLLGALGDEQLSIDTGVHDWSSLNRFMTPQDEGSNQRLPSKPRPGQPSSIHSTDDWGVPVDTRTGSNASLHNYEHPVKTASLFSLSDESFTSGEDFSSLDWGTSSGESDDAFRAMMANLSEEEANVFGFHDDAARLSSEHLNTA